MKELDLNYRPNIRLRPLQSSDADALYQLLADGRVSLTTTTIPFPYHAHHSETWIQRVLTNQSVSGKCRVQLIDNLDIAKPVGVISVQDVGPRIGNVAYWVGSSCWGKGIATEALRLAISQGWQMEFDALVGKHLSINSASGIVLKRNGFISTGVELVSWRGDGVREMQVYRKILAGIQQ